MTCNNDGLVVNEIPQGYVSLGKILDTYCKSRQWWYDNRVPPNVCEEGRMTPAPKKGRKKIPWAQNQTSRAIYADERAVRDLLFGTYIKHG